jgi:uncharacterized membrane protein YtjA (UPF0391 family)
VSGISGHSSLEICVAISNPLELSNSRTLSNPLEPSRTLSNLLEPSRRILCEAAELALAVELQHAPGGGRTMLYWALVFLLIGLVSAALGFSTVAGASFAVAKFLAGLFLLLFLIFLVLGLTTYRKITS